MAKCTLKEEPIYILELSKLEAETLYRLLGNHVLGVGLADVSGGIFRSLSHLGLGDHDIETDNRSAIFITEELPE